jgi:glutathione S-transferase
MLCLESTPDCNATPRVLFTMEEAGLSYELRVRQNGYFQAEHGRLGPLLSDQGRSVFEVGAILRYIGRLPGAAALAAQNEDEAHEIDAWIDVSTIRIALPLAANVQGPLQTGLGIVERRVATQPWLLGRFSLADCAMHAVLRARDMNALSSWPAVLAYAERLAARHAWARARARLPQLEQAQRS